MARPKIIETPKQIHDRQKLAVLTRILRVALGLSQLELAKRTGLSFSTIAKFENGELRLHENKKAKIFSLFDEAGLHYSINTVHSIKGMTESEREPESVGRHRTIGSYSSYSCTELVVCGESID